ncbi:MAG TPA: hypothetical protein VK969_01190, partial [Acidimicrobiia bacterium]|nr:hypothetical protein [Acidimicrobiia bacterium]
RRSMFRTAWNTALILFAGWIVVWFVSVLVVQPTVVNRGDRAADAARMSIDLTQMLNPGLTLTEGRISPGFLSREVEMQFAMPIGAGLTPATVTTMRIGALGIDTADTPDPRFPLSPDHGIVGDALDRLENLGNGTVATAAVRYGTSLPAGAAQEIADDPAADVRVVWAGFDGSLGQEFGPSWTNSGTLGYGTCSALEPLDDDLLGATSAGFTGTAIFATSSIDRALQSVLAALENIEARPELVEYVVGPPFDEDHDDVAEVLTYLRTAPAVSSLVVTGPTPAVSEFVADARDSGATANVLAVDFYNWNEGICGR